MLPSKLNLGPTCILEGLLRKLYLYHIDVVNYPPVNIWHVRSWGKFWAVLNRSYSHPEASEGKESMKILFWCPPNTTQAKPGRGSSMSCEEMGEIPPSDGMDFPPYRHFKLAQPSASLPNPHSTHPSLGHQIGYPDKNATSLKNKIEPKNIRTDKNILLHVACYKQTRFPT